MTLTPGEADTPEDIDEFAGMDDVVDHSVPMSGPGPIWNDVVGQQHAIEQLRAAAERGPVHAYLFVGPAGSTKLEAARAFAAVVMSGGEERDSRDARLSLVGEHPDVREVRRAGASISVDQAREIVRLSSLAPSEGSKKVLILDEFHLLQPSGAALMLKTIEEPPESTMFIILCDFVPHDLITISSRCARIDFRTISADVIAARLLTEGVNPAAAMVSSKAALGNLDRARVLATDPALAQRRAAFAAVPEQLDGTGAVAVKTAAALLRMIDDAAEPLTERHAAEVVDLDARIKAHGERGSGKKQLDERHKRELRRHRTDELASGLATIASTYRDRAVAAATHPDATPAAADRGTHPAADVDLDGCAHAVSKVHEALAALERNPNERLLLETLLWSLPGANGRSQ